MSNLSLEDHLTLHNLIKSFNPKQHRWLEFFRDKNGVLGATCNFCNVSEMSSDYENKNLGQWINEHGIKHLKLKAFL